MTVPSPRPALRRAPDADVHPAAPHVRVVTPVAPVPAPRVEPEPAPEAAAKAGGPHRLSGPPRGRTSDTLRVLPGRSSQKARKEKRVDLDVTVPKSLRKEFLAAAKSSGHRPDEIVETLLHGWLRG